MANTLSIGDACELSLEIVPRGIPGPVTQTVVSDYTAILTGETWSGDDVPDHPAIVTYSFSEEAQPYLLDLEFTQDFVDSFVPFTEAQKNLALDALSQWAAVCGIILIEAPAGEGDIQFGRFDFREEPSMNGFAGYAFYPNVTLTGTEGRDKPLGGDVFIDAGSGIDTWLMLHEIGHALGFKHPFAGDPTLQPSLDNQAHTVMSYTGNEPSVLGSFDDDAAISVYGTQAEDGTHLSSWSWNAATATLTQIGTTGADTFRGTYGKDIMSGAGGNDILLGSFGNDTIDGKSGFDSLFGGGGDDTLIGRKGADRLDGGDGLDVFVYATADESHGKSYDTLVGFDPLDQDRIDLSASVAAVDPDIDGGALSTATFKGDLRAAADRDHLLSHDAVLFNPDAGELAGLTFLVIDINGRAGYQPKQDLVLLLDDLAHAGQFDTSDFI